MEEQQGAVVAREHGGLGMGSRWCTAVAAWLGFAVKAGAQQREKTTARRRWRGGAEEHRWVSGLMELPARLQRHHLGSTAVIG
jgi:hypothetical protein